MSHSVTHRESSKATSPVAFFFGPAMRVWLAGLLVLALAQGAWADAWRVGVEKVLDGDTVVLSGGERLRLRGIDAPETAHNGQPGQYFAKQARRTLSALVEGRELVLDRAELDTDRHGRLVGVARLDDGRVVNLMMIEQGAAFVYPHPSDKDNGLEARLRAAQRSAMDRGRGFWPAVLGSGSAPAEYVGTRSSKRFHVLSCPQGRKARAGNQVRFSSLREAFAAGYAPARECTPWPSQ
jgi:micrococcal nuclease